MGQDRTEVQDRTGRDRTGEDKTPREVGRQQSPCDDATSPCDEAMAALHIYLHSSMDG